MNRPTVIPVELRIPTPSVCRRAWARYLGDMGCNADEIGRVLGIPRQMAAKFLRERHAEKA